MSRLLGQLFGLSAGQIANAISIATADNVSLACIHVEPVSQWKGFSPGMTGMRAVYTASMAKRGFTGPAGLFEGPWGLDFMFNQPIPANWEDPSLEIVKQTVLKKYCSLIHGQPVIEVPVKPHRPHMAAGMPSPGRAATSGDFEFWERKRNGVALIWWIILSQNRSRFRVSKPVPRHGGPAVLVGLVDRLREGVGSLHHDALTELAVEGGLQGMIVAVEPAVPHRGRGSTAQAGV
jgi:hypothetical protein